MTFGGPAERFMAGAVGRPGQRTFFVYAEIGGEPVWFLAEKEQVAALGAQSIDALPQEQAALDQAEVEEILAAGMEVPAPAGPEQIRFRIGAMAMRVDFEARTATIFLTGADDEEEYAFEVTIPQLRAMALAALASVHSGRAICPRCQLPEDPEGHDCPSRNGHKRLRT